MSRVEMIAAARSRQSLRNHDAEVLFMRCLLPLLLLALPLVVILPCAADWPRPGLRPDRVIDLDAVTYYVSPDGSDANDGRTRQTAFGTLQKAADVAEAGDGGGHDAVRLGRPGRAG